MWRPRRLATAPVVPVPKKGSTMMSPGFVQANLETIGFCSGSHAGKARVCSIRRIQLGRNLWSHSPGLSVRLVNQNSGCFPHFHPYSRKFFGLRIKFMDYLRLFQQLCDPDRAMRRFRANSAQLDLGGCRSRLQPRRIRLASSERGA